MESKLLVGYIGESKCYTPATYLQLRGGHDELVIANGPQFLFRQKADCRTISLEKNNTRKILIEIGRKDGSYTARVFDGSGRGDWDDAFGADGGGGRQNAGVVGCDLDALQIVAGRCGDQDFRACCEWQAGVSGGIERFKDDVCGERCEDFYSLRGAATG